ncbi:cob(I)yrinic acid a,c-diamide adenosyltransferase [Reinekea thalattae]|uniref:Corrinoid adenosyltransferase n=1 Tax=Reinekea thalattae TaxID=2593301 RepID=A0A5C8Z8T3_9GAMM|nr:cob(I)yrinic acid a,c-diamide adenosyltransferase [Reinekea thalattae]TXR53260.1 cob(I)yrinic acid a,c-diamide adenosyltransferase [Reinekea thalattae]
MGFRLSKIYTRTGDKGDTGLGTNERISKASLRIHAIGDIDELNSCIGVICETLAQTHPAHSALIQRQHDLFDLGGELAMPGYELLTEQLITDLEQEIDRLNQDIPPLENFILPGGNLAAAHTHMARSICRRAERSIVAFNQQEQAPHLIAQGYLNRLSDYLFVLARYLVIEAGGDEVLWQSRHKR